MTPLWYLRRLRSMAPAELLWRLRSLTLQQAWRARRGEAWPLPVATPRWAGGSLPGGVGLPEGQVSALVAQADAVLEGNWPIFSAQAAIGGTDPDWFRDPMTGRVACAGQYFTDVPYRDEAQLGNVKALWEVSRQHHITLLAAAYHQTRDARYAERAVAHLQSWWRHNPPLCGVHWVSGIELGLRLVAWVWTRRLLDGLPGIGGAFEHNPLFQRQLHAHQCWLATFRSRGSSANNHLLAEMAGLLASSLAFPLFQASAAWARLGAAELEREIERQTFADGLNREMAGGYHVFALELLLVAACEADAAGAPLREGFWRRLQSMADALAATLDTRLQGARQGDADDGRALLLSPPGHSASTEVLGACGRILGVAPWWPRLPAGTPGAAYLGGLARSRHLPEGRPTARPNLFPHAGISILRDMQPGREEIWCRLDHGPHGYLSTAAHAHADALSFELRFGGQQILTDPGTYCYHGETEWRQYFRSTVAHNTLELHGQDQAQEGGPFLWLSHPAGRLHAASGLDEGERATIEVSQGAYRNSPGGALHRRRLVLDRSARSLEVLDVVEGSEAVPARLAFNLHPDVECRMREGVAELSWAGAEGVELAKLVLPEGLRWSVHRGETAPILGWYSDGFGRKKPATLLLGHGQVMPGQELRSRITFLSAPSWGAARRKVAQEA
ncbi:alginate lyase family protein [Roseomonas sp. M0104]|uniref:Alginate lyase family protein n=1 Tax=Teichococcus coralli TaxID=2545983 RepID=A0A845B651_9PROT|nr:alginate lyase family protein [Pseudoroseomonas coralli]MXP63103.1 alginate lyase family protein [Pseudoroseomonas coralli]